MVLLPLEVAQVVATVLTWDGLPPKATTIGGKKCSPKRVRSDVLNADVIVCKEGMARAADGGPMTGPFSPSLRKRGRRKGKRSGGACSGNTEWINITRKGRTEKRCRCNAGKNRRFVKNALCEK